MACSACNENAFKPRFGVSLRGPEEPTTSFAQEERWDVKRDVLAAGVGFALPIVYAKAAPKRWPQLGLVAQIALVVGGYFGTVWVYKKFTT